MELYIIFQILIVAIAATSTMTLFSYAVSASFREMYKEPVLLTYLLTTFKINLPNATKTTLAWLLHYGIGVVFVTAYHYFWARNILELSIVHALLLGIISGFIGIISWMVLFKIANYKPSIDYKGYYIQLFVAHVIFALTATAVYAISLSVALLTNSYFVPR